MLADRVMVARSGRACAGGSVGLRIAVPPGLIGIARRLVASCRGLLQALEPLASSRALSRRIIAGMPRRTPAFVSHRSAVFLSTVFAALLLLGAPIQAAAHADLSIDLENNVWKGDLDALAAHRAIRVLVPYSKTLYFVDFGGTQRGLCYDFMRAFEDSLNKKLGARQPAHPCRVRARFAGSTHTDAVGRPRRCRGRQPHRHAGAIQTRGFRDAGRRGCAGGHRHRTRGARPAQPWTISPVEKSTYSPRSSYFESLTRINDGFRSRRMAPVKLRNAPGHFETEDILEMANAGLVNIVVADDYLAKFWKEVYPNITLHPDLVVRTQGDIAFAIRKNSPKLQAELDEFTRSHRVGTLFGNVDLQKYLQQTRWARNAMSQEEVRKFDTMVALFRKYGNEYEIDWLLMAAQGYQESQLDQTRRSQAGAVGVMQLTPATGEQMGVGDIHELDANIHAGIKYVRFMVDTYYADDQLDNLNKVLFAIASYNAGPNRVRELRKEAAGQHLNPECLVRQRRAGRIRKNRPRDGAVRQQYLQVLHRLYAGPGGRGA
jgi:membrane-bound lytic murein transglycosylase MltF